MYLPAIPINVFEPPCFFCILLHVRNLTFAASRPQVLRQLREAVRAVLLRRLRGQPEPVRLEGGLPAVVPVRVPAERRLPDEAGAGAVQGLPAKVRSVALCCHWITRKCADFS